MAIRLNSSLGSRPISTPTTPRIAPPTDLGLGDLANSLSKVSDRIANNAERKRAEAESELKYQQRKAEAEAEAKKNQEKDEADNIIIMEKLADVSKWATDTFETDTKSGSIGSGDYINNFQKNYEAKINETISQLPEDVQSKARVKLTAQKIGDMSQYDQVSTKYYIAQATGKVSDTLNKFTSQVAVNPSKFGEAIQKIDETINAISDLDPISRDKLKKDAYKDAALARIDGLLLRSPGTVLNEINGGKYNNLLESDDISRAKTAATQRSDQLAAEARAEAARQRALAEHIKTEKMQQARIAEAAFRERNEWSIKNGIEGNMKSVQMYGVEAKGAPTTAMVERVLGKPAADAYASSVKIGKQVYVNTANTQYMNYGEMTAWLQKNKPQQGAADFNEKATIYSATAQQMQSIIQARRSDPAGYWLGTQNYNVRMDEMRKQNKAQGLGLSEQQMSAAVLKRLQTVSGGATDGRIRYLSNDEAVNFGQRLKSASASGNSVAGATLVSNITSTYGKYAPNVLMDIEEKAGVQGLSALANVSNNNRQTAANLIFSKPNNPYSDKDKKNIRANLNGSMSKFWQSLPPEQRQGQSVNDLLDSAVHMANVYQNQTGASTKDTVKGISGLFLDQYTFKGNIRYPSALGSSDINRITINQGKTKEWFIQNPTSVTPLWNAPGQTLEQKQKATVLDMNRNGKWITLMDDSGVMLVGAGGNPYRDKNGLPITRTWKELRGK